MNGPARRDERATAEAADRAAVQNFAGDRDNGQTLRMLLSERRGRFSQEVRAEIGQRYVAHLRQLTAQDHPGMTMHERLFPNAKPIADTDDERVEYAFELAAPEAEGGLGIDFDLAAVIAGVERECPLSLYQAGVQPIVRRIRLVIESGDTVAALELERKFAPVLNGHFRRVFSNERAAAIGCAVRDLPQIEAEEL